MSAPGPRPTAPGRGSEFKPWNAHPVRVRIPTPAVTSTLRTEPRAIMAPGFPRAAASDPHSPASEVPAIPNLSRGHSLWRSWAVAGVSPLRGSAAGAAVAADLVDHPAVPCRPILQAVSPAALALALRRPAQGEARCR